MKTLALDFSFSGGRYFLLLTLLLFFITLAHAQTTSLAGSSWSDAPIWSTGAVPGAATSVTVDHHLTLDANLSSVSGYYKFNKDVLDPAGGTNYTVSLASGGTLEIAAGVTTFGGSLSVANGATVIVRSGATLSVASATFSTGSVVTIEANATLTMTGTLTNSITDPSGFTLSGLINAGTYSSGVASSIGDTGGDLFTTNTLTTANILGTVFGSTQDCGTGPCSARNLCPLIITNAALTSVTGCAGPSGTTLDGTVVVGAVYAWESSTTSSTAGFTTASGTSNAEDYVLATLTQTTWYRRKATVAGCTGISAPTRVFVLPSSGGWHGITNSNWHTASNWCDNTVPTASTDVVISFVGVDPVISANATCRKITLQSGTLTHSAGTFTVYGDVTNNSTGASVFSSTGGTVVLAGTAQQTVTSHQQNLAFSNLSVTNTSTSTPAVFIITPSVTVSGTLTLNTDAIDFPGALTLGVDAGTPGTLTYTQGRFYGTGMTRWVSSPAISDGDVRGLFPLGSSGYNRPLYVSFPTTLPTGMGTLRVFHYYSSGASTVSFLDGASTVQSRSDSYWNILSGNGLTGGTYNLQAGKDGFGVTGVLSDLRVTRVASVTGTHAAATGTGITNFLAQRTGITLANLAGNFYIGSVNSAQTPLPVELIFFRGDYADGKVLLDWATASESNFDKFIVQRSIDGTTFENIGSVKGAGNSKVRRDYSFEDNAPVMGRSYYRLVRLDMDGFSEFSNVIAIQYVSDKGVIVYPNPSVDDVINVRLNFDADEEMKAVMYDLLGNEVRQFSLSTSFREVNLEGLQSGIYILKTGIGEDLLLAKIFKR